MEILVGLGLVALAVGGIWLRHMAMSDEQMRSLMKRYEHIRY